MGTKEKKYLQKDIFLLIILIVIALLAGLAYARYITSLNGNISAQVAKWYFNYKILNSTQTKEVKNLSVTRTDGNNNVDSNTIAPGTSGEFFVEIDATRHRNFIDIWYKNYF